MGLKQRKRLVLRVKCLTSSVVEIPPPGEVMCTEEGQQFVVIEAQRDGDRHLLLTVELPPSA